jgi:hypothetical protein
MVKHKDTKAQRHQETRHQMLCPPAFLVPLCLGVFVFNHQSLNEVKAIVDADLVGACSGGKFVVFRAGKTYDDWLKVSKSEIPAKDSLTHRSPLVRGSNLTVL